MALYYEKSFQEMKQGLQQIHKDIFDQSATKTVKMIVGNRNRRNATHELKRKKPAKSLLKNKPHQSECHNACISSKIYFS